MKTFRDIYKFPLHKLSLNSSWVMDEANNFVFQFEPQYKCGNYLKGWPEFERKVITKINGIHINFEHEFKHENGMIYYLNTHVMTIRGWGNLTGVGGHNLPPEEAANIQDTFADFIVEQLNLTYETNTKKETDCNK